jgi:hypothetical protein
LEESIGVGIKLRWKGGVTGEFRNSTVRRFIRNSRNQHNIGLLISPKVDVCESAWNRIVYHLPSVRVEYFPTI